MLDLGVYIVIAALIGAKLLLLFVNFNYFRNNPDEILVLARSGGVFYGGLITATLVAFWYIRRHKLPFWTTCDMFAPGIALGHVIGRLGCLMAGCCYGRPADVPWADHLHRSVCRRQRRHAVERAAAPDAGVRGGRGADDSDFPARDRTQGAALSRPHVLGLHAALRRVALHHRVLPRRRARLCHGPLDVAVHLGRSRAAEPAHAVLPRRRTTAPEPAKAARRAA